MDIVQIRNGATVCNAFNQGNNQRTDNFFHGDSLICGGQWLCWHNQCSRHSIRSRHCLIGGCGGIYFGCGYVCDMIGRCDVRTCHKWHQYYCNQNKSSHHCPPTNKKPHLICKAVGGSKLYERIVRCIQFISPALQPMVGVFCLISLVRHFRSGFDTPSTKHLPTWSV